MKVSYKWLQDLVPFAWSPQELADNLTMTGVTVDQVYPLAGELPHIVVGEICTLCRHPQADNLLVAQMNIGKRKPVQVITGANNIKVGHRVPVALPGARLVDGKEIGAQEFRGLVSQGMMCSAEELGLEPSPADEGGIMLLPPDTEIGKGIRDVLGLDDYVLELDLTPNRGDCLSMVGVAREVAALLGVKVKLPAVPTGAGRETGEEAAVTVKVQDPDLCLRYSMRIITDLKIGPSPLWLQQRIRAAGMRPINNMVDVTNYVMLELGQPLHAFDYDRIKDGSIIVRRAKPGEKLVTLDGKERELHPDMLLIADPEGAVGIAGVMGGANSEVSAGTRTILLESACFHHLNNRKTTKALGLRSEASNRFEKGVDPNGTLLAANRAAYLMEELGAGRVSPQVIDIYPQEIKPRQIIARTERINQLLGTKLPAEKIKSILTGLEFKVTGSSPFTVEVPTYRPDVEAEYDLVEEVARIYGYNRIEGTMIAGQLTPAHTSREQAMQDKTKELLAGWGYSEIVTYSFYNPRSFDRLRMEPDDPVRKTIALYNPLTEDQSVMRTTLLPNMLDTMALNLKRKNTELALFELGRTYWGQQPLQGLPEEIVHLALGLTGRMGTLNWQQPEFKADFFALKGTLEALMKALGITGVKYIPEEYPVFHPGRQATLYLGCERLGIIGEIHPDVAEAWEITEKVYLGELNFSLLCAQAQRAIRYRRLPRYPAVARDMALLIDAGVAAEAIGQIISKVGGELLVEANLFDIYQGEQIPAGKKSIAYSLVYQARDRTLTDEEVTAVQQKIVAALEEKLGIKLR
jgi:phenylalanyl-tRNA synthetase beta chain